MPLSVVEALTGKTVLITGATGYVGKVVVEKLLREVPGIKKILVLIRGNAEKRLRKDIFSSRLFDSLFGTTNDGEMRDHPLMEKVFGIQGDICAPGVGIPNEMMPLVRETNIIIHCAATVDFDEKLDDAIKQNVLGSLELLEIAQSFSNLEAFIHVSTAYVNCDSPGYKTETLPKLNFDPEEMVRLILQMTPAQIEAKTKTLVGTYPNTYAFSKAISEILMSQRCQKNGIPLAIVRPTIIGSAVRDPSPGWIDSVSAIAALVLFSGVGLVRYTYGQPYQVLDIVPVDTVSNVIIACIPRVFAEPRVQHIYHVGTSQRNPVKMIEISRWISAYWRSHNVARRVDHRPMHWKFYSTKLGFDTRFFIQNRLPASLYSAFANTIGTAQQRKNAQLLKKINQRTLLACHSFAHFTNTELIFGVQNTEELMKLLNEEEREVFMFGVDMIDWEKYFRYFAYGMHRYVLKEEVKEPTELLKIDLIQEPRHLSNSEGFFSHAFSDLSWAYKSYKPNIGIDNFNTLRTPAETQVLILKTNRVRQAIEQIAAQEKVSVEKIEKRAAKELSKMAHTLNLPIVRALGWFLRKVFRRMYQGIHVEEKGMEMIRKILPNGPLVLIPTHRSYIDFLIISYIFFEYDLPLPHIAAGEDFLSILFVNWIFRCSGAFFLRRTFKGDQLYSALFTEYVQRLVKDWSPIEFFIEGKRSRIGRSLQPKFGLLSMTTDPFFQKSINDLTIVPISISYEKVLEAEVYTNELLGEKKTKESLQALVRASRVINLDYGRIHVICNEPISMKDFTESFLQQSPTKLDPFHKEDDRKSVIQELGHKIVYDLNKGLVHTTTALVATILLTYRGGITHTDLVSRVNWLRNEVTAKGATIAFEGTTEEFVARALKLLSNLVTKQRNRYVPMTSPEKGHKNILVLDFYRNQILHLFTGEGIVSCAFSSVSHHKGVVRKNELVDAAKTLSKLFQLEFIHKPSLLMEENFDHVINTMLERHILTVDEEGCLHATSDGEGPLTFYCQLYWPLIDSYWVSALSLFSLQPKVTYKRNHLLQRIQWLIERMHSENKLSFYESCSMEVLVNTLSLFHKWKLIDFKKEKSRDKSKVVDNDVIVFLLAPYQQESPLQEFVERINYFRQAPVNHSMGMKKSLLANFPVLAKL